MTGRPGVTLPAGWDDIPGARGCTLETCGFRDHHADLAKLQTEVYGVSVQTTEYQQEMVERLKVPFEVLSDADMKLVKALKLPTFTAGGMTLIKRLTHRRLGRPHRARVLSGVPAGQARRRSDRVAQGASHLLTVPARESPRHLPPPRDRLAHA